MSEKQTCQWSGCIVISNMRCGKCRSVYYCCAEHQKLDWKVHKQTCGASNPSLASLSASSSATAGVEKSRGDGNATGASAAQSRQCRCMFCGEALVLDSEEAAVDHMRYCPALQEQLDGPGQYTIPKAFQNIVDNQGIK